MHTTGNDSKKATPSKFAAGRSISSPVQVAQELWEAKENHQWMHSRLHHSWNESPTKHHLDSSSPYLIRKLAMVPNLQQTQPVDFDNEGGEPRDEATKELDPEMGCSAGRTGTRFSPVNSLQESQQDRLVEAIARITSQLKDETPDSPTSTTTTRRRHSLDLMPTDDTEPVHTKRQAKKMPSWLSQRVRTLALGSVLLFAMFVVVGRMVMMATTILPCLWFRCKSQSNVVTAPTEEYHQDPREATVADRRRQVEQRARNYANVADRHRNSNGRYRSHDRRINREKPNEKLEERSCVVSSTGECIAILRNDDDEKAKSNPDNLVAEAQQLDLPYTQFFPQQQSQQLHQSKESNDGSTMPTQTQEDATAGNNESRTEQLERARTLHKNHRVNNNNNNNNNNRNNNQKMNSPRHRFVGVPAPTRRTKVDLMIKQNDCTTADVHELAHFGKLEELQQCLTNHPDWVNHEDDNYWTAIHEAASSGWLKVVEYLVSAGASVTAVNNLGRTAYQEALLDLGAEHEVTKYLQQYDTDVRTGVIKPADVDVPKKHVSSSRASSDLIAHADDCTENQIQGLAYVGDLFELRRCLSRHPEWVNQAYDRGWTPLHYAARAGHAEVVKFLLESGANLHAHTTFGNSALDLATKHYTSDHPVVQILLDRMPNTISEDPAVSKAENPPVNRATLENAAHQVDQAILFDVTKIADGCIPEQIQWLADVGKLEELQRCLTTHPDLINHADDRGWTPIHEAARAGHTHVIEYLIRVGAKVDAQTHHGQTPLDLAKRQGEDHPAVIALLQHQAQPHTSDESPSVESVKPEQQGTVAQEVPHSNSSPTPASVPAPLAAEADSTSKEEGGCTQEHFTWLIHVGRVDEVKLCLSLHPEYVKRVDNLGWTPLHEASRAGNADMVKLFLQSGIQAAILTNYGQSAQDLAMESHGNESAVTQVLIEHTEQTLGNDGAFKTTPSKPSEMNPVEDVQQTQNPPVASTPTAPATQDANKTPAAATHSANIALKEGNNQKPATSDNNNNKTDVDCLEIDFLWSASLGELDNVKRCLSLHPEYLDITDENGWTATHEAARSGHVTTVEYLVQHGANVHMLTVDGRHTPLELSRHVHGDDHAVTKLLSI